MHREAQSCQRRVVAIGVVSARPPRPQPSNHQEVRGGDGGAERVEAVGGERAGREAERGRIEPDPVDADLEVFQILNGDLVNGRRRQQAHPGPYQRTPKLSLARHHTPISRRIVS